MEKCEYRPLAIRCGHSQIVANNRSTVESGATLEMQPIVEPEMRDQSRALAEFTRIGGISIIRDGNFSNICFYKNNMKQALTFAGSHQDACCIGKSDRICCVRPRTEISLHLWASRRRPARREECE